MIKFETFGFKIGPSLLSTLFFYVCLLIRNVFQEFTNFGYIENYFLFHCGISINIGVFYFIIYFSLGKNKFTQPVS